MIKMNKISEFQSKIQFKIQTLHFHSIKESKCLPVSKQKAFVERQEGFCLKVAEALVNVQESCHTGAVLLCLPERINLCLSPPSLGGLLSPVRY